MGRRFFAIVWLGLLFGTSHAQVGREFVSIEAYVSQAHTMRVGKIEKIEQLERLSDYRIPCRISFSVEETIKGVPAKNLVILVNSIDPKVLIFLAEHHKKVLLVSLPNELLNFPQQEEGVEEQGRSVAGELYQFRMLEDVAPLAAPPSAENMYEGYYDHARFFDCELDVLKTPKEILGRVRSFVRQHPTPLPWLNLLIPRAYGELCGDPNAFALLALPKCAETERTLARILKNPEIFLGRVTAKEWDRRLLMDSAAKELQMFPSPQNDALVRKYLAEIGKASP